MLQEVGLFLHYVIWRSPVILEKRPSFQMSLQRSPPRILELSRCRLSCRMLSMHLFGLRGCCRKLAGLSCLPGDIESLFFHVAYSSQPASFLSSGLLRSFLEAHCSWLPSRFTASNTISSSFINPKETC